MNILAKVKHFLVTATLATSASLAMTSSANAYVMPVVDFGNIVQTTITAIEEVESMIQDYVAYEELLKTNIAKLEGLEDIASKAFAEETAAGLATAAGQLEEKLQDGLSMAETLKSWYGASKKSPAEFLKQLGKQKEAGDQHVVTLMDNYFANGLAIQDANASLQKLNTAITKVNGPTEGLQAVALAVGILVKQQNSMISIMQLNTIDKAEAQAKKNKANEGAAMYEKNYKARVDGLTTIGSKLPIAD